MLSPKKKINEFCMKLYNKECNRFSTFADGEVYGIIGIISIPYSTVVDYEMNRDKNKYSALKVDGDSTLWYGIQKNGKFYKFNGTPTNAE